MIHRRSFIKYVSGTGFFCFAFAFGPGGSRRALAQAIPGGTLDPVDIPKYVSPLLIPPAMPRAGKIKVKGGKYIDYYEIAVRQFPQQILPAGLPATMVWGYGPKVAQNGPAIFNSPSLTIEAKWNAPVRVKWINELVDAGGDYLPHLLPVDPTLHWANPPGGESDRDTRPSFATKDSRTSAKAVLPGPAPALGDSPAARAVGDRAQGHGDRVPESGEAGSDDLQYARAVRVALPHRRARGQRDDAAVPDRPAPARAAGVRAGGALAAHPRAFGEHT